MGCYHLRIMLAALGLAGCTSVYSPGAAVTTTFTPPIFAPIVINAPPTSPVAPPASGLYSGWASMIDANPGVCAYRSHVTGFEVEGDQVRFGPYRGRIKPDGSLEMIHGRSSVVGQFNGGHFQGQVNMPGVQFNRSCSYLITLDRA